MEPSFNQGERYAHNGVMLRCDKGVVPGLLTVLPRPSHVNGQFQANTGDCMPLVNIPPFGVCAVTRTPCLPPMLIWTGAHLGAKKVGGLPPLVESSVCQCGLGGRISITMPPPPGAMTPPAPKPFDQQTPDEQDATLHEASGTLKELAGGLALVGLGAAVGGLFFPPLEIVAAVALGVSEVMLVAAVAIDVAVAVTHPTVDNWLVVGGDVLAVGLGYVVGKVVVGPAFNALAKGVRGMMQREAAAGTSAALPKTAQAVEEALAAEAAAAEAAAARAAAKAKAAQIKAERAEIKARAKAKAEAKAIAEAEAEAAKPPVAPKPPSRTLPSGMPDPNAKPSGTRTRISPKADEATRNGLEAENHAADIYAQNGYKIEQNPKVSNTTRDPDYRIEGEIFDNYAPNNSNATNIYRNIEEKVVVKRQAERISLYLKEDVNAQELAKMLNSKPISNLKEVIAIQNGKIINIFP